MIKTILYQRCLPVIILLFIFVTSATGQQSFRGNIVFDINYAGSRIDLAEQEQLPKSVEITARDNQALHRMQAGELQQVKITDSENQSTVTLLDIDDEKYSIMAGSQQIEDRIMEMPEVEFVYTDEYENILGYPCRKVLAITYDSFGEKFISEIFFTHEYDGFPLQFDMPYREIPGLMLKYEVRAGNLVMQYEAASIEPQRRVSTRIFRIPPEYQPVTFEDLREQLSGEI